MKTSSNGNIFRVTGQLQRPVTRSFDVFFDLCPNKRLSKQWWGWWFEMRSSPLWRHCNGLHEIFNYSDYDSPEAGLGDYINSLSLEGFNISAWNLVEWCRGHVTHNCVSGLDSHCFRKWLVTCSAPSHYLNQWWIIIDWIIRNKFQCNSNQSAKSFV